MVKASRTGNLGAVIQAGKHELLAGVAASLGGADEGPEPHELLESALAACTIITVQMYANRKEWALSSTGVEVHIDKEENGNAHIMRTISFEGKLDEEQRARLLEIANKCPIHKLLSGQISITTQLLPLRLKA